MTSTMTLNPNALPFVPISKTSKNNKNKTKSLDALQALSTSVAEKVLQPLSHIELELKLVLKQLLAKRALEATIIQIPKITNVDRLEQVAQISYHHRTGTDFFELFWDGTHAILDNRDCSWRFPNMTISDIIHYHFNQGTSVTISPDSHDLASYAPAIQIDVTPIC